MGSTSPQSTTVVSPATGSITGTTNSPPLSVVTPVTGSITGGTNPPSTIAGPTTNTITGTVTTITVTTVNMMVSFTVNGGGTGFSPPTFNYIDANDNLQQYTLTTTPTQIVAVANTVWSISSNTLGGSTGSERWYCSQAMTGTASASTLVFTYQNQYLLTVQTSGLPSSSYPTNVYLDGSNVGQAYDASAYTEWLDAGAFTGTIGVDSPLVAASDTHYLLTGWSDSSAANPHGSLAMVAPATLTADYQAWYQVTVSSAYGTASGSGWYPAGNSVTFSVSPTKISGANGAQYTFTGWSGSSTSSFNSVTVADLTGPLAVTANWQTYLGNGLAIPFSAHGLGAYISGVAASPDGKYVYVTYSGCDPGANFYYNGGVAVIDTSTNTVVADISESYGPEGAVVSPDGQTVYIINAQTELLNGAFHNPVSVMAVGSTPSSDQIVANILLPSYPLGGNAHDITITTDGAYLYVSNGDVVSKISTSTDEVVASTGLLTDSNDLINGLAVTPNGQYVYVATSEAAVGVAVIATSTMTVTTTIPDPRGSGFPDYGSPYHVFMTPSGVAYVDNYYGSVLVINTATNKATPLPETATDMNDPTGMALSTDGAYIYFTTNGPVTAMSTATNTVTATLSTPSIRAPDTIAIAHDGEYAYVPNTNGYVLWVINTFAPTSFATTIAPSPNTVAQGKASTISPFGWTLGTIQYTYQWLQETPGASNYTPITNSGTASSYTFGTDTSTTLGNWNFELQVTDSHGNVATSNAVTVTVVPSGARLQITADSPVNVLLTDQDGNKVGADSTGTAYEQILGATYTGAGSEPQVITLPGSYTGTFGLQLYATGTGPFTLTVANVASDGTILGTSTWTGTVNQGETWGAGFTVNSDGSISAGSLFMLPEYVFGALMAIAACFLAFIILKKPKLTLKNT